MLRLTSVNAPSMLVAAVLSANPAVADALPGPTADSGSAKGTFAPSLDSATYYRVFAGTAVGRGLRFNNPYRLETQLGDTAESVSLTSTYVDAWAGAVFGAPEGIQHGGAVHGSVATEGITQEVLTPSYVGIYPVHPRWLLGARAGFPIVVEPDANVGVEAAALAALFVTASVGLSAELVGSLFYGAATLDAKRSAIPILSFQMGVFVDYEVLP